MSIEIRDVARRFGSTAALEGVSLTVARGEFVALLGPSGSGKTTLLRILAGLEGTDSGTVRVDGEDMTGVPARERRIGVVFQQYALFRHMTVFENVAFGLRVRKRRPPEAEIARRVRELLALVQIPELERRYPDQVSGGQRQRVALARALAIEPRLLLLDEPFGALDALVRKDVRRWVRGLHDRLGISTILVTHDQEEAMEMADRVAVMERGRIVQCDTAEVLLRDPATPFVAGFLGEASRLDCQVRGGVAHFDPLPLPPLRVALPDGEAQAFLRPEDIAVLAGTGQGILRAVRNVTDDRARVIVDLEGILLDGTAASGRAPQRNVPCRVALRGGIVFASNGQRARGEPLARIMAG
ncbi:sulfate/molybdate ABC transporter ATP-binding protein [Neoroseomonas lacus]|uniref:Sulfate/thiosulfate import ATP-binding protein CysA n=1 Tax=Neoroseomonas lacus TaxID=287609 RepID=A0A917NKJ6_9PROT|nr:sulfate/molybdate ABC transporter ATP-binding protein [Neoroseomonas lacus]GGJ07385.1 sulfate/thiosulfate import ATP-binding protein CysA [Neoroseomonas lacus]